MGATASPMVLPREDLLPINLRANAELERPFSFLTYPNREPEAVSFRRLNNAVNRASWFLRESCLM